MQASDLKWSLEVLRSETCLCGKKKKARQSFCPYCFQALPRDMQAALYRKVLTGYEEAFEAAVAWLQTYKW